MFTDVGQSLFEADLIDLQDFSNHSEAEAKSSFLIKATASTSSIIFERSDREIFFTAFWRQIFLRDAKKHDFVDAGHFLLGTVTQRGTPSTLETGSRPSCYQSKENANANP